MARADSVKRITVILLLFFCLTVAGQEPRNLKNVWGKIDTTIAPWATNVSRPNKIDKGLQGRHVSLWQSHGRYYDANKGYWKWQRPNLFCTTEDLFTQTIVVPFLIPMLENAGAYVFTPRERDWQKREIIVDNDFSYPAGKLYATNIQTSTVKPGFRFHTGTYRDGENPFTAGTGLTIATQQGNSSARLTYVPEIKEAGRFAVYVSYPHLEDAVDDVHYIVCHKGIRTEFVVNQQIGYGTWVYLGTFDFGLSNSDQKSTDNCVILSASSSQKGHIGADAVRFGGGMGNIVRNGLTSGMPRSLEGARYSCQWAGAPYSVYSSKEGQNDYADDINARSLMTNWLGGGSCYIPTEEGLGVPFELTVAVHSDAGFHEDGTSIYGSLAIATTDFNNGRLAAGITRQTSLDLASQLLDNLTRDMQRTFGRWERRFLRDRNYSETRIPEVPSAIIETLSHQNFPDVMIGEHPYGKFAVARSIYKTILRYISTQHNKKYVIEPLPPKNFRISLLDNNRIELSWEPTPDKQEPTANPTSYNVYTAMGEQGFDNGQNIEATTLAMSLTTGVQYNFQITACNDGGESFPTETLSAYVAPNSRGLILVVNGFERLSAPYIIDNAFSQGFDLERDEGVQYGLYAGWSGKQTCFDRSRMGIESETGLGYCGDEMAGRFVMGNEFNYVAEHTRAIASMKQYSVVSCSLAALRSNKINNLSRYSLIDLAFGLQKDDGQLGLHFKTFSPEIKKLLEDYTKKGGALLVSGAYLGSDMQSSDDQKFMQNILKLHFRQVAKSSISETIRGLGATYDFYHSLNDKHYAATHPEVLSPESGAICTMQYSNGSSAAVGYKGKYACFTMGFPFECIKEQTMKNKIMQGILTYLLK